MKRLAITGLGWFGMELGKSLRKDYIVSGTKRKPTVAPEGISIHELSFAPLPRGVDLDKVFDTDYLVLNIPPNARSEGALDRYSAMMDVILDALIDSPVSKLIFVSSTGVFGDGQYHVDEKTAPSPSTLSGRILMEAERKVLDFSSCRKAILRPAGLVGGQRHPARFLAGRENLSGRSHPVNLVHRSDLIAITRAILESESDEKVFHAVASEHPSKEEYYSFASEKLGLPRPHFDEADTSRGKVVSGEWSKRFLDVSFEFDDPKDMLFDLS